MLIQTRQRAIMLWQVLTAVTVTVKATPTTQP